MVTLDELMRYTTCSLITKDRENVNSMAKEIVAWRRLCCQAHDATDATKIRGVWEKLVEGVQV